MTDAAAFIREKLLPYLRGQGERRVQQEAEDPRTASYCAGWRDCARHFTIAVEDHRAEWDTPANGATMPHDPAGDARPERNYAGAPSLAGPEALLHGRCGVDARGISGDADKRRIDPGEESGQDTQGARHDGARAGRDAV
jgi:hypothetical protein